MILDITAGNRGIWAHKKYADCVYVDLRENVFPDIVADSRSLPFSDAPPHVNCGARSIMTRAYGHHTTAQIREIVNGAAREVWRVSTPEALMALSLIHI